MGSRKSGETRKGGEPIAVYLTEPGAGRPPFSFEQGPLAYLPSDAPMPRVRDVLLLPRTVTGDGKSQAFAWGGRVTPFRVLEVEHLYFRDKNERNDPAQPLPAHYVRCVILVRRLTRDEYGADPGGWILEGSAPAVV